MPAGWGKIRSKEILSPINGTLISGDQETVLAGISTDSRTTRHGDLFWALRGERYDGHDFAPKAIEQGAAGIVAQNDWVRLECAAKDTDSDIRFTILFHFCKPWICTGLRFDIKTGS